MRKFLTRLLYYFILVTQIDSQLQELKGRQQIQPEKLKLEQEGREYRKSGWKEKKEGRKKN